MAVEYACLAILMTVGFATIAYSQQSKRKAAALPKYSRDWTTVVHKIVWTFDAKRMMRIGERAGLEITTERAGDRQTIWFDDPLTHETELSVSICEDAFPISASARVPNSTTNQKECALTIRLVQARNYFLSPLGGFWLDA
jgi:hypothetical protein